MQKTVVCIDNDPGILVIYRSILADCGYEVLIAPEGRFGLHLLEHHVVDVVLVDYDMPEMDGGIVAAEISRRMPNVAIVLISGYDEVPAEVSGHIQAFVGKPFTTQQLLHSVETAIAAKSEPILSENLTATRRPLSTNVRGCREAPLSRRAFESFGLAPQTEVDGASWHIAPASKSIMCFPAMPHQSSVREAQCPNAS